MRTGSVLIVVLGLLAILAIVGITFVTMANMDRAAADNFAVQSQMNLAADLTSCAPAFYAAILRSLTETGARHGSLTEAEIREISLETVSGTVKLLREENVSFNSLIKRVATPGGITEEGVKVLDRALPAVFDEVLGLTLAKREKIKKQMRGQYGID